MKRFFSWLAHAIDLRDVIFVAGVCVAAYGFYLIYPPASFLFIGGIAIYLTLFPTIARENREWIAEARRRERKL